MRNDRWSTDREIKNALKCFNKDKTAGGPVLYYNNGANYVYDKEGHMVILGVSGSGKSRRCTMAMVRSFIESGESFLVIDPKGEIYYETAGTLKKGADIHVIDFRHIYESEHWNPLALPYELYVSGDPVKKQVALEIVDELAFSLYPVSDKADPFWPESARSVFVAVVLALFDHAKPEQVTMASVYQVIARGEERNGVGTTLKSFVETLNPESVAAMLLQSYVSTANDTRAGIRSTFLEGISMFARSDGLIKMLGSDDLHINGLDGKKQTGIYIILPDESPIFDRLAGILCSEIMSHYIRLAQDKFNGKLPRRLNICLEELGNVGKAIGNLPHMMSAGRSRGIRCQIVLQSLSQLFDIYGQSNATTILSNADVTMAFRTNNWDTLTELSRKCGERDVNDGNHTSREPLITQSQLAAMETGQALIIISGSTKFITWLPDYREMYDFSSWTPPKKRGIATNSTVSTFNISEYVKDARKNKMEAILGGNGISHASNISDRMPEPVGDMEIQMDDLVARIDAKIAALEAEEAEEKKKAKKTYRVIVSDYGKELISVAAAISSASDLTVVQASKRLKKLPAEFSFDTKKEADKVKILVENAGGSATIKRE